MCKSIICANSGSRHTTTCTAATITSAQLSGGGDVGGRKYPLLAGIYGDEFNPIDDNTHESVRSLLSEIMNLLDASHEGIQVKDFAGHIVSFVRVPRPSSDKLFNNTKSWVDEALKINGSTHNGTFESAFCVSNHLCNFTGTQLLQQWKSKAWTLYSQCRHCNL